MHTLLFICNPNGNKELTSQYIKAVNETHLNINTIIEDKKTLHKDTELIKTFGIIIHQSPFAEDRINSLYVLYKILNIHNVGV